MFFILATPCFVVQLGIEPEFLGGNRTLGLTLFEEANNPHVCGIDVKGMVLT